MKKTVHPAIALFDRLFQEVASKDAPLSPDYFVPRSWLRVMLIKEGIEAPANIIEFFKWEEEIGLRAHATRVIAKYQKARKTKLTP